MVRRGRNRDTAGESSIDDQIQRYLESGLSEIDKLRRGEKSMMKTAVAHIPLASDAGARGSPTMDPSGEDGKGD